MTVTTTATVRSEAEKHFLLNVFITALEGGIGYWSEAEMYHWSMRGLTADGKANDIVEDLDGFYAMLVSSEEDWGIDMAYQPNLAESPISIGENDPLRVDIDVVAKGAKLTVQAVLDGTFTNPYLRQFCESYFSWGQSGDYDSEVADIVVQMGLFGEVVYA